MDPPVNPPEEIDDPEDSKPEDWVRGRFLPQIDMAMMLCFCVCSSFWCPSVAS